MVIMIYFTDNFWSYSDHCAKKSNFILQISKKIYLLVCLSIIGIPECQVSKQMTNLRMPLLWSDDQVQWQNPCDTERLLSLL